MSHKAFMSSKVSDIYSKKPVRRPVKEKKDDQFWLSSQSVFQLAAENMNKKEKRQYDANRLRALGGTPDKAPKMPIKMLLGKRKKDSERLAKRQEQDKLAGVIGSTATSYFDNPFLKKKKTDSGMRERGIKGHSVGRFSGGMLKLSKKDIETVSKSGNKRRRRN
eukprot:GILJ01010790.1.p1 GENE.GILJ01010790.1~~GILJ01010790.1.p1  ORF type:complete len:164 (-),score=24.55 GILJ01010790.1:206-697(-)